MMNAPITNRKISEDMIQDMCDNYQALANGNPFRRGAAAKSLLATLGHMLYKDYATPNDVAEVLLRLLDKNEAEAIENEIFADTIIEDIVRMLSL